jgi:hypothetical protein
MLLCFDLESANDLLLLVGLSAKVQVVIHAGKQKTISFRSSTTKPHSSKSVKVIPSPRVMGQLHGDTVGSMLRIDHGDWTFMKRQEAASSS